MIILHNGYKLDFVVASGALGFDGKGYWWDQPFRWLGYLKPEEFTIITKTLTFAPQRGNYVWWHPWSSVRLLFGGSIVNKIGLTNPGIDYWIENIYPKLNYNTIVSICPESTARAAYMAKLLDKLKNIVGLEINVSCPNTEKGEEAVQIVHAFLNNTSHPVIVKLGYDKEIVNVCKALDNSVAAFDLINAVPWEVVYPDVKSPLDGGGVSGRAIKDMAVDALVRVKAVCDTPIISGGGICDEEEIYWRFALGADAVAIGTMLLHKPWLPNKIVAKARKILEIK
jgi:dihydroorotate dehydrogenase (NAD+) catalytic subunit